MLNCKKFKSTKISKKNSPSFAEHFFLLPPVSNKNLRVLLDNDNECVLSSDQKLHTIFYETLTIVHKTFLNPHATVLVQQIDDLTVADNVTTNACGDILL